MSFPILDFDSECEAMIEPSKLIKRADVPQACVICFFAEVIAKVVKEHNAKVVAETSASSI